MKSACMKGRELERPGTGSLGEHHFQEKAWGRLPCQRPNCNMQRMNLSPPAGLVVFVEHHGDHNIHAHISQLSQKRRCVALQRYLTNVANLQQLYTTTATTQ